MMGVIAHVDLELLKQYTPQYQSFLEFGYCSEIAGERDPIFYRNILVAGLTAPR